MSNFKFRPERRKKTHHKINCVPQSQIPASGLREGREEKGPRARPDPLALRHGTWCLVGAFACYWSPSSTQQKEKGTPPVGWPGVGQGKKAVMSVSPRFPTFRNILFLVPLVFAKVALPRRVGDCAQ